MTGFGARTSSATIQRLKSEGARLKLGFLETEIQTCLTLVSLAKTNRALGYYEAAESGIAAARKGFRTALGLREQIVQWDPEVLQRLSERMDRLRSALEAEPVSEALTAQPPAVLDPEPPAHRADSPLTRRETEVLRLVVDGKSTKEIAGVLGISFKTAACHRASIMDKLDVPNAASLVSKAIRDGLV